MSRSRLSRELEEKGAIVRRHIKAIDVFCLTVLRLLKDIYMDSV